MKIVKPSVELIWITPDAAKVIEFAARTCYKSEAGYKPENTASFLDRIANQYHHESVIEHASACFQIVCDRGVSHELVRHRLASFSQESTRYCNYSKDKHGGEISVILPPGAEPCEKYGTKEPLVAPHVGEGMVQIHTCPACMRYWAWEESVKRAEQSYFTMLHEGATTQIARSVLPTCLKTELRMTANFREWKHIIALRTTPAAHPQIKEIVSQIQLILQRECPEIFGSPPQSSE